MKNARNILNSDVGKLKSTGQDGLRKMVETKYIKATSDKLKKLKDNLYTQGFKVPEQINRTLFTHGNHMRNAIISAIKNTQKSGKFYKATKTGKKHESSAPGYPPAIDTGELWGSYNFDIRNMELEIGSRDKKSKWLEDGTKNKDGSVRMEARPVLDPTVEAYKDGIYEDLDKIAQDIMTESFRNSGITKR